MGLSGWEMKVPDMDNSETEENARFCELMVYLPPTWDPPKFLGGGIS